MKRFFRDNHSKYSYYHIFVRYEVGLIIVAASLLLLSIFYCWCLLSFEDFFDTEDGMVIKKTKLNLYVPLFFFFFFIILVESKKFIWWVLDALVPEKIKQKIEEKIDY